MSWVELLLKILSFWKINYSAPWLSPEVINCYFYHWIFKQMKFLVLKKHNSSQLLLPIHRSMAKSTSMSRWMTTSVNTHHKGKYHCIWLVFSLTGSYSTKQVKMFLLVGRDHCILGPACNTLSPPFLMHLSTKNILLHYTNDSTLKFIDQ